MPVTGNKFIPQQIVSKDTLDQLYKASEYFSTDTDNIQLSKLLISINKELTPPLRLTESTPNDLILHIGSISVQNPETDVRRTIPPISNVLPAFTSGTVTFPASSGGNATPSSGSAIVITISSGNYLKVGINLDANGDIVLQSGTQGASEALATVPPSVPNTFGIGFVVLHNVAGTIQNISDAAIFQYVGGGGGSGTGDANDLLTTLKDMLLDSIYQLLTYNIFAIDSDDKIHGSSTGAFNLVTQTFDFSGVGQTLVSTQNLDDEEFLTQNLDVPQVDLAVYWLDGFVDEAAVYEVSRDAGVSYQTIDMSRVGENTGGYYGSLIFDEEVGSESLHTNATVSTTKSLNTTTQQSQGQQYVPTLAEVLTNITLLTDKVGSPSGNFKIKIVADDSGAPSTESADILVESAYVPVSSVPSGASSINVTIPRTAFAPGTYHLVVETDATYKASYSVGVTDLRLRANGAAGTGFYIYNGTTWSNVPTTTMGYTIFGHVAEVRVRITSSVSSAKISGYGLYYNVQSNVAGGVNKTRRFDFAAVADNTSSFDIGFVPDPLLLRVEHVQTGQMYSYPAFSISGSTVAFPANTFNNGGVETPVTLWFKQVEGTSFDNSDTNAALLAANHLGATSGVDYSSAGRGIYLRRPDGTLREVALDNSDNIVVLSTP